MKTVRFSNVVHKAGRPQSHLLFVVPAKDRVLQTAIKAHRVMTVEQSNVGSKADRGRIGFFPGTARQFLLFPKSLRAFANCAVVGIKYDLLATPEIPKSQRVQRGQQTKTSNPKPKLQRKPHRPKSKPETSPRSKDPKIVAFVDEDSKETNEPDEITKLKDRVRRAMKVLEGGKPVAAFNLLKRIVES